MKMSESTCGAETNEQTYSVTMYTLLSAMFCQYSLCFVIDINIGKISQYIVMKNVYSFKVKQYFSEIFFEITTTFS